MIGLFDSGVGGLSIWREIVAQLPDESIVSFADQAHVPYGSRPMEEIRAFSEAITRFLLGLGCRIVVVACNTASAAALTHLRSTFPDVPFVGMEPAVKPAAQSTRTGKVGVMATPATFQGELFASVVERFANGVQLVNQVCPGLVEQVEAGRLDTPDTEAMLRQYLTPMMAAGVDTIVLACTHYPFLAPAIRRIVGPDVQVIDPAPAIARQVRRVMEQRGLLSGARVSATSGIEPSGGRAPGEQIEPANPQGTAPALTPIQDTSRVFYTSGDAAEFARTLTQLVGVSDPLVRQARWDGSQIGPPRF